MITPRREFLLGPALYLAGDLMAGMRTARANPDKKREPGINVEIALARTDYQLLEPFEITVTVSNDLGRMAFVPHLSYSKYQNVELEVVMQGEEGRKAAPASRTRYYRSCLALGSLGKAGVEFKPGDRMVCSLIPSLVWDMTVSGLYSITASVEYIMEKPLVEKKVAKSKPVVVEIKRGAFVSRRN